MITTTDNQHGSRAAPLLTKSVATPERKRARSSPRDEPVAHYVFRDYGENSRSFHVFPYDKSADPRNLRHVPHRHDFYQFIWLKAGHGELECDLKRAPFRENSLFFFAPGRMHSWRHRVATSGVLVGVAPEFFNADTTQPGFLGRLDYLQDMAIPMLALDGESAAEMDALFQDLLRESANPDTGIDDIVRALLVLILTRTRRLLNKAKQDQNQTLGHAPGLDLPLARRFRAALETHFPKLLKVSDYAALLHVSRSHLNDELRRHTGLTASDHIHDRLLLEAKRLLVYSPCTISEIAYHLEFRDPSYFGRFFRQRTAITPGEYRAREQGALINGRG